MALFTKLEALPRIGLSVRFLPPRIRPAAPPSPVLRLVVPRRSFAQTQLRRNYYGRDHEEKLRNAKPLFTRQGLRRFVRSPSTHAVIVVAILGAAAFYFSNIQTVPVSGRRRFNCYSDAMVERVSAQQVKRIEYEVEQQGGRFLGDWDWRTIVVKRVMKRLIPVSGMSDADWEVRVIDDPGQANAFVLPGGKVFVYSGIIAVAGNEDGIAAVLGHEIAHNLAQHIGERLSGQIGINILLYSTVLLTAFWGGAILGQLFGGSLLDVLFARPMGRLQETEADYIGLLMMAEACYDPKQALAFWQRMERLQQTSPPEWMSTHPSNHNRIEKIKQWLPEALEKRAQSDCAGTAAFADRFRRALAGGVALQ